MAKQALTIGQNISASLDGDVLTLTIDLSRRLGSSVSGKNQIIATTSGNQSLPNGAKLGINCYTK